MSSATVEMAQTPLYFYIGKEPALAYATGAPFGMNHRHQDSWWSFGGGAELCNEALKPFKTHAILCGNSGTQMGGWFRKEIKTVDDLQGLKFRIAAWAVMCWPTRHRAAADRGRRGLFGAGEGIDRCR